MDFTDRSVTVEGYKAHYIEGGSGYPLLLIHGSGPGASTLGNWRRVLEPLARQFHVHAMDLIGFGRSDRKRAEPYFDISLWLSQCQALIELMPGTRIGVIGHSLSGALALKLAAREPRIAQVLTTASMGAAFPITFAAATAWTYPATRDELRRTAEFLIHDKSLIDDDYLDARMKILHSDSTYGTYFSSMFGGDKQSYIDRAVVTQEELAAIHCKVTMLHGRNDVGFPPSISLSVAERLPQADVTLLGFCSHSIAMEQPEKFLAATRSLFSTASEVGERV
jgi:2-hydroxymuconate-semialdehyde hydrolase